MGWFNRSSDSSSESSSKPDVTDAQLREIGRLVNKGRLDEAQQITESTSNPRGAAFAAFRYINLAED